MKLQKNGLDFINNDNAINPLDKYSLEELHILLQCVKTAFGQHKKNGVLISGLSDEDNKRYMAIYSEAAWYYFYRRNRQITYEYFAELVEIEIKLRNK